MSESALRDEEAPAATPSPALAAPPGNPRFPLFDGLREIALLAVLLLHSSELSGRVGLSVGGRFGEAAGGLGVIAFFVISGFLLYRPFAAARAPECSVCCATAGEVRCDPTPSRTVIPIVQRPTWNAPEHLAITASVD
jgi:hypothetical protein